MTDLQSFEKMILAKIDIIEMIEEGIREAKAGNVMTIEETADYIRKNLTFE